MRQGRSFVFLFFFHGWDFSFCFIDEHRWRFSCPESKLRIRIIHVFSESWAECTNNSNDNSILNFPTQKKLEKNLKKRKKLEKKLKTWSGRKNSENIGDTIFFQEKLVWGFKVQGSKFKEHFLFFFYSVTCITEPGLRYK